MPTGTLRAEAELASRIHSTCAAPGAAWQEVLEFATKSVKYGFPVLVVQGSWAGDVRQLLRKSKTKLSVFVGYTLGGSPARVKVAEVEQGIDAGADMFEYLPNLGFLRSGLFTRFREEMSAVVKAAGGRPVCAALELPTLSTDERIRASLLAEQAGVAILTNSSGWGAGGPATDDGIRFLRGAISPAVKVKATGGVRSLQTARQLMESGADLLGTSSGAEIIEELRESTNR